VSKRKMPDTCAKCEWGAKATGRISSWGCLHPDKNSTSIWLHIPCSPGRLPLPLKDCPRRKA
jgi:hypothetical protein